MMESVAAHVRAPPIRPRESRAGDDARLSRQTEPTSRQKPVAPTDRHLYHARRRRAGDGARTRDPLLGKIRLGGLCLTKPDFRDFGLFRTSVSRGSDPKTPGLPPGSHFFSCNILPLPRHRSQRQLGSLTYSTSRSPWRQVLRGPRSGDLAMRGTGDRRSPSPKGDQFGICRCVQEVISRAAATSSRRSRTPCASLEMTARSVLAESA